MGKVIPIKPPDPDDLSDYVTCWDPQGRRIWPPHKRIAIPEELKDVVAPEAVFHEDDPA